jgi:SAM-dependent methyltransferase
MQIEAPLECACAGNAFELAHTYSEAPPGEIRFAFSKECSYRREILRCRSCGHFVSRHNIDTSNLYADDYVSSTYGGDDGLRRNFERIIGLDPQRSDNTGRVRRVVEFAKAHFGENKPAPRVLDVGSGLCVFLYRMKAAGWQCTALDPDQRSIAHARETVGVDVICGDFMENEGFGKFDVITFNKVLEHVENPVEMLRKAVTHLEPHGFVYIELPDGEGASADGFGREEFFIEHLHIFSFASFANLVARAGLNLVSLERIREPSTKFTLRGFALNG